MMNLTIEQQKEFEKMVAEINRLHSELNDLVKENREREQRDNNIKKSLIKEIDKLKKKNLELIRQNNKINKRLSSYEKNLKEEPILGEVEGYEDYFKCKEEFEQIYCE